MTIRAPVAADQWSVRPAAETHPPRQTTQA